MAKTTMEYKEEMLKELMQVCDSIHKVCELYDNCVAEMDSTEEEARFVDWFAKDYPTDIEMDFDELAWRLDAWGYEMWTEVEEEKKESEVE